MIDRDTREERVLHNVMAYNYACGCRDTIDHMQGLFAFATDIIAVRGIIAKQAELYRERYDRRELELERMAYKGGDQ